MNGPGKREESLFNEGRRLAHKGKRVAALVEKAQVQIPRAGVINVLARVMGRLTCTFGLRDVFRAYLGRKLFLFGSEAKQPFDHLSTFRIERFKKAGENGNEPFRLLGSLRLGKHLNLVFRLRERCAPRRELGDDTSYRLVILPSYGLDWRA